MATVRQLVTRLGNLERQRSRHGEFQIVEENHPEGQFNGECHYVLLRNSMAVFRWPKKPASIEEWETRFALTDSGVNRDHRETQSSAHHAECGIGQNGA